MDTVMISINDILDELMSENKRLFNELLFANNCFNELKTHLINIHSKYQTIIDCQDIQRWDQLSDKFLGPHITPQPIHQESGLQTMGLFLVINSSDGQLKSTSNTTQQVMQTIDGNNEDIEEDMRYRCQYKDCNKTFKIKFDLIRHSVSHQSLLKKRLTAGQPSGVKKSTIKCNEDIISSGVEEGISLNPNSSNESQEVMQTIGDNTEDIDVNLRYRCPYKGCNKSYDMRNSLTKHLQDIHPNSITQKKISYKTITDNETQETKTGQYLRDNREERHKCLDTNTNQYICPINECHKSYETDILFVKHLKRVHTNRRYICHHKDCGKVFIHSGTRTGHMRTHRNDKQFKCPYNGCDYESHYNKNLKTHMNIHSTDRPVFKCDVDECGKAFASKERLTEHKRSYHNNELIHKCNVDGCGQLFATKHYRVKHQVAVHNRKPRALQQNIKHRCDWPGCEWTGTDMSVHKRVHTGDKPYVCKWPDCDKRFRRKGGLDDHMNVHNNVKPYGCQWPGCDYKAANSSNIVKHKKQVHSK